MNTIHTRIRHRRENQGLTMKALADLVGVTWQTVQQWEREDAGTAPKRERLSVVARALNTTPEELLFGFTASAKANENSATDLSSVSREALSVAHAFDNLKSDRERESIIALLKAFNAM